MKAKLWEVTFDEWRKIVVNAKNANTAINKAIRKLKADGYKHHSNLDWIEKVELLATED